MPFPRTRRSSASSSASSRACWRPPNRRADQVPSSSCTIGITTLPVMSPPITSTRALYTFGAFRNFFHSTSVPWMSEA